MRYPLARNGVFRTVQGEGALMGVPMVFVRLAGCSVGCDLCDTDYRVHERATAAEIRARVEAEAEGCEWVWVTGGEPADHDLLPLVRQLQRWQVAVATSGMKSLGAAGELADFVSLSPHSKPADLAVTSADQLNLVPGLGGLRLGDWRDFDASWFAHRWVTPLWYTPGDRAERIAECVEFVRARPGWRLGVQAHKCWGLP